MIKSHKLWTKALPMLKHPEELAKFADSSKTISLLKQAKSTLLCVYEVLFITETVVNHQGFNLRKVFITSCTTGVRAKGRLYNVNEFMWNTSNSRCFDNRESACFPINFLTL